MATANSSEIWSGSWKTWRIIDDSQHLKRGQEGEETSEINGCGMGTQPLSSADAPEENVCPQPHSQLWGGMNMCSRSNRGYGHPSLSNSFITPLLNSDLTAMGLFAIYKQIYRPKPICMLR